MECVILLRKVGGISFISDDDPTKIAVFKNEDEAVEFADKSKVCMAWPYQIVVLDEL